MDSLGSDTNGLKKKEDTYFRSLAFPTPQLSITYFDIPQVAITMDYHHQAVGKAGIQMQHEERV